MRVMAVSRVIGASHWRLFCLALLLYSTIIIERVQVRTVRRR